ncbi:MAG: bile acid:sodium symporter family protein [Planctomycetes bacterium]|nr:bile acid:sodium symporter family protein [Planctomycetota bacterium]
MLRIMNFISRGLVIWVVAGAWAAYVRPEAFAWTRWPLRYALGGFLAGDAPAAAASPYDLLGQPVSTWMFAMTMFAVGTVIDPASFIVLARRPLAVLLGLATQFTVMPALACLFTLAAGLDPDTSLGFIIVGCAPGAMTSNVLTYLARGDTAYSVTLTTIASVMAVFITPLLVRHIGGAELGVRPEDFWSQLWTIAWSVASPLLAGLCLRIALPKGRRVYEAASPAAAVLGIVVICCFVIQWTREHLQAASAGTFAGVVIVNALGFLLGGVLARVYRLPRAQQITLSIEVGMQNAGMGVVLAATTFADRPRVAIPAALFTIWCIVAAAALIALLKRRRAAERAERS